MASSSQRSRGPGVAARRYPIMALERRNDETNDRVKALAETALGCVAPGKLDILDTFSHMVLLVYFGNCYCVLFFANMAQQARTLALLYESESKNFPAMKSLLWPSLFLMCEERR